MSRENTLVITAYGHGDTIDKIAISTFEKYSQYYSESENARTYCDMTNSLELKGDNWVFAKIVPENTPFSLKELLLVKFEEIFLSLDDKALQKVLRELDKWELAKAIKYCSEAVIEKTNKNMTSRAQQDLNEEMERIVHVRKLDIADSQEKVLAIIRHLQDTGEIVIHKE